MKRFKPVGRSARRGHAASPYEKYDKRPYKYPWEARLTSGELRHKANDKASNKYTLGD